MAEGTTEWSRTEMMRLARQRETDRRERLYSVALVDASAVRLGGMPNALIKAFAEAAEGAWEDVAVQLMEVGSVIGRRPSISLRCKMSTLDPQAVVAMIGQGGKFGTVEATTPTALRAALARHLAERFGRQ
jgi:hypothetical protein